MVLILNTEGTGTLFIYSKFSQSKCSYYLTFYFAAISNISSPDYHDDDSVGIRDCVMEISDHSDSDSTLLGPEPGRRRANPRGATDGSTQGDHKIVIQVRGPQEKRTGHGNGDTVGQIGEQVLQVTVYLILLQINSYTLLNVSNTFLVDFSLSVLSNNIFLEKV